MSMKVNSPARRLAGSVRHGLDEECKCCNAMHEALGGEFDRERANSLPSPQGEAVAFICLTCGVLRHTNNWAHKYGRNGRATPCELNDIVPLFRHADRGEVDQWMAERKLMYDECDSKKATIAALRARVEAIESAAKDVCGTYSQRDGSAGETFLAATISRLRAALREGGE